MIISLLVLILLAILFPGFMRTVFVGFIALFLLAMILAPAHSSDGLSSGPPVYDVEAGCRRQASDLHENSKAAFYNECVSSEQRDYDFIKMVWPRLSDRSISIFMKVVGDIYKYQKIPIRMYGTLSTLTVDLLSMDDRERREKTPQRFTP